MKFLVRLLKRVLLVCFFFSELAFSETGRAQRSFVYTSCHLISSTSRHEFAFCKASFCQIQWAFFPEMSRWCCCFQVITAWQTNLGTWFESNKHSLLTKKTLSNEFLAGNASHIGMMRNFGIWSNASFCLKDYCTYARARFLCTCGTLIKAWFTLWHKHKHKHKPKHKEVYTCYISTREVAYAGAVCSKKKLTGEWYEQHFQNHDLPRDSLMLNQLSHWYHLLLEW